MTDIADLGLDDVPTDPNFVPDGTYASYLTKIEMRTKRDDASKRNLVFTFKIAEGEYNKKEVQEYKSANKNDDVQKKSYLKQRIVSLGVPEAEVSTYDLQTLVGNAYLITIKNNGQFRNITNVKIPSDADFDNVASAKPASAKAEIDF